MTDKGQRLENAPGQGQFLISQETVNSVEWELSQTGTRQFAKYYAKEMKQNHYYLYNLIRPSSHIHDEGAYYIGVAWAYAMVTNQLEEEEKQVAIVKNDIMRYHADIKDYTVINPKTKKPFVNYNELEKKLKIEQPVLFEAMRRELYYRSHDTRDQFREGIFAVTMIMTDKINLSTETNQFPAFDVKEK